MTTEGATTIPPLADSLDAVLAQLRAERQEAESLRTSLQQSASENELLRAERQQLLEDKVGSTRTIAQRQHQLQHLLRRLFGRSAEKIDPKQKLLFETLLNQLAPEMPAPAPVPEPTPPTSAAPASKPATNGHGRRRLPADLPHEKIIHDLPEEQKTCPCCNQMRHVIGREISEQLDYVPAKLRTENGTRPIVCLSFMPSQVAGAQLDLCHVFSSGAAGPVT